jgi:hypothetical protein
VDKSLNCAIPLVILYVFKDKAIYNEIEYIYSIAPIAVTVIELGVKDYFLYAYRQSDDRDSLIKNVKGWFLLLLTAYQLLGAVLLSIAALSGLESSLTCVYILVRTIYIFFLSFFTVYYRLVDRPAKVFTFSISVNLVTLIILAAAKFVPGSIDLVYLFVSQAVLCVATLAYYASQRSQIILSGLTGYVKRSLAFAWPIIANLFLSMFISNYGKMYSRNFLSQNEMFHISFVQRTAIFIWLAHASLVGYLTKRIFLDLKAGIDRRVLVLYSTIIVTCVGLVFAFLLTLNFLQVSIAVEINAVTFLIVGFTVVWCYVSFFELYINRINKNKYILLFSTVAAVIFLSILLLEPGPRLYSISLGMFVSMLCNLSLVLWFLYTRYSRICV